MKFKGLLIDLDNTFYDYDSAHQKALDHVLQKMSNDLGKEENLLLEFYLKGRALTHDTLKHTAASHNRMLYFQSMLEMLDFPSLIYAYEIHQLYWKIYLKSMQLREGVRDFLLEYDHLKTCIVTDFTSVMQYEKIMALGIEKFIDFMVTSEEVGREKPDSKIFFHALSKLNLKVHEVCMVGDSFKNDIEGARNLGIEAFWIDVQGNGLPFQSGITQIKSFTDLQERFKNG